MENYPSNSIRSRQDQSEVLEKKVEKVVTGTVVSKKKSGLMKLTDALFQEDISNIKSYIFTDVVIPAIKKTIFDTVTNGLDMLLNGGSGKRRDTGASNISYSRISKDRDRRYSSFATYDFNEVILDNRADAERVLNTLDEIIDQYRWCSVADFYETVGVSGSYTDRKYGWSSLRSATIEHVYGGGFRIRFPKAMPID